MWQRILIADDEVGIVNLLRDYFEINGYEVLTALNGQETLKQVEKCPDLILLDINMPDVDGLAVCSQIRNFISCPILFLTARVEDADKINGFLVGGDDYIVKPFSIDELGARVSAHLRREERHKAAAQVKFTGQACIYAECCARNTGATFPLKTVITAVRFLQNFM